MATKRWTARAPCSLRSRRISLDEPIPHPESRCTLEPTLHFSTIPDVDPVEAPRIARGHEIPQRGVVAIGAEACCEQVLVCGLVAPAIAMAGPGAFRDDGEKAWRVDRPLGTRKHLRLESL